MYKFRSLIIYFAMINQVAIRNVLYKADFWGEAGIPQIAGMKHFAKFLIL